MDAAIRKAKDSIGQIFDKNLHDLVRGIRNHKENESKYITECIDEIKQELKQDNTAVKANAINKLCYLQMIGYDISWAAFNVIEVMSSTKFTHKRIGYLAAAQSFHDGTDVLMLTTNLIRKDLSSQNMYEAGTALSGLACFITPDLARDLVNEIMTLMNSNKPFLRKKAVLIMYKVFLKYPDALRPAFPRLKEKLDDPDPSVQAAAVNVICELARKNPKNYLSLAPIFFKLMTVSTNNWVLIKIIKLFGALTPLEPRLGKKLIEPLTNLINSTSAMSLLYECINTVLAVLVSISKDQPNHESAIQVCLQKLRILIEDSDQNLKYLGLLAMSKILQTNPKAVQAHKDLIMQCLDDKDESIRLRSLDLLYGMVSKKNLMEIIKKLMVHMNKAEGTHYRDELLAKIIDICSQNNYQYVTNFEWYVSVLVELTGMEGTRHGKLLSSQMLDVAIRVEVIRPFVVSQMAILLDNMHVFTTVNAASVGLKSSKNATDICEVLFAATWICGEFAVYLNEPFKTMDSMLKSKVTNLPGHIQSVFVQNIFKLYVHIITKIYTASNELEGENGEEEEDGAFRLSVEGLDECKRITQYVIERTQIFEQSADIEVQERACSMLQILKYINKIFEKVGENEELREQRIDLELKSLFDGELNPVAPKAQRKVPIPEGLDLDEWINDPPSEPEDNSNENAATSTTGATDSLTMFAKATSDQSRFNNTQNVSSLSSAAHGKNMSYSGSGAASGGFGNNTVSLGAKTIQPELSQEELDKLKESRRIQNDSNPFYIKAKKPEASGLLQTSQSRSGIANYQIESGNGGVPQQIRSQSIDLKIPLQIPGVTSSDSYLRMTQIDNENRRLKKKMKKKLESKKSGSKKKGKRDDEDEDEEEENAPAVKVLDYEMPEGANVESGDEEKRDVNDPHRALDIDLDEPLKENERLYRSAHRSDTQSSLKNKSEEQIASALSPETKPKEKKTKKSKKAEEEVTEKTKSSKKEKKSSKTTGDESKPGKKSKVKSNQSIDLLISTEPTVDTNQQDYNELMSPVDSNTKSLTPNEAKATNGSKTNNTTSDDLDFWLETSKPVEDSKPVLVESSVAEEGKKKKSKKSKSSKKDEEDEKPPVKEKKKSKKSAKKEDLSTSNIANEYDDTLNDDHMSINEDRLDDHNEFDSYKKLAANKHLQINYLVVPNQMNLNQIVIGIKLKNIAQMNNSLVHSLELSLLDTDNLSLIRSQLNMSGDTIKIPFSLTSSEENEVQFYFNAAECTIVQKLRGTLTYMLKSDDSDSSIQEKFDLKINIPCSGYLLRSQCSSNEFSNYLTSGDLTCKSSVKLDLPGYDSVTPILKTLCLNFSLVVVETLENHASLFTSSIQNHPVCILIKYMDKHHLSIDIKSSNQSLVDNLLDEIKSALSS